MMKNKSPQSARQAIRLMMMVLALTALPFGLKYLEKKFNSRMIASHEEQTTRGPASVDRFDLSLLDETEFKKAFKYQMLSEATIITTPQTQGVRLGHFLMSGAGTQSVFACERFPFIELTFKAEGVAFSGEIPTMTVRGPCIDSNDHKTIEALMIPFSEILTAPLTQTFFRFPIPEFRQNVAVVFAHVVEHWPTQWNLIGIKLYSEDSPESLNITGYEVISVMGSPLTLDFKANE